MRAPWVPTVKQQAKQQDNVTDCFEDVVQLCVESNRIAKNKDDPGSIGYGSKHIWKLPFIFEQLVLSPSLHTNKKSKKGPSCCQLIQARLRLFRAGQLSDPYNELQEVVNKSTYH